MASTDKSLPSPGRALGEALRAYYGVVTENQRKIIEGYVRVLLDSEPDHAARYGQRIVGATAKSQRPVPAHVMGNFLAELDQSEAKQDLYRGLVGQRGGRPKKVFVKTALGVNRVAPDVAALVQAAPNQTAYVEAAVRAYAQREQADQ